MFSPTKGCPKIGDVFMMRFGGSGSAQSGWRPGIVIQNDIGNYNSPNIIAIPLTSVIKSANQPTHVVIDKCKSGLQKTSMALCESPESIPKSEIGKYITHMNNEYMEMIAKAFMLSCPVICYISSGDLISVKSNASRLVTA